MQMCTPTVDATPNAASRTMPMVAEWRSTLSTVQASLNARVDALKNVKASAITDKLEASSPADFKAAEAFLDLAFVEHYAALCDALDSELRSGHRRALTSRSVVGFWSDLNHTSFS